MVGKCIKEQMSCEEREKHRDISRQHQDSIEIMDRSKALIYGKSITDPLFP